MGAMSGQCLCGAVKFKATPKESEMGVCHCAMCQRWAGGVFMAVSCGVSVEIEDETQLGVYQSSDWGERCFCKVCGSTLFWRMRDGTNTAVSAAAFEDSANFAFTSEIFIDEKPSTYEFANVTKQQAGPEVIAAFTAQLEKGAEA
ncbi:MAG: GFA family protein [Pseudomonadota bacterium]